MVYIISLWSLCSCDFYLFSKQVAIENTLSSLYVNFLKVHSLFLWFTRKNLIFCRISNFSAKVVALMKSIWLKLETSWLMVVGKLDDCNYYIDQHMFCFHSYLFYFHSDTWRCWSRQVGKVKWKIRSVLVQNFRRILLLPSWCV